MSAAEEVLTELSAANSASFETARPMPGMVYHSDAFAALERERIFRREWICMGRVADFEEEGAFVTETIADVPVLVVRQEDGSMSAFLNACAHRFAKLVEAPSGKRKLFVCPYHAWAYDAAGRLVRTPYMEAKPDFDADGVTLRELHTDVWEGFLYVTLSQERPASLSERLQDITQEVIGRYRLANYETVIQDVMPVRANWKNMIENFIESYHIFAVHAATFGTAGKDPGDYTCASDMEACAFHFSARESEEGVGAAPAANTHLDGEWRRTSVVGCVFPNHLITLAPDYLWSVTVHPEGTDAMRAVWSLALAPEVLAGLSDEERQARLEEWRQFMDQANGEDKPVIEALHEGTHMAPGDGHYHPIERNLWNFATYLESKLAE